MLTTAEYPGAEGKVHVHVAKPSGEGPFPAVVLGHEIFGITDFMLDSARMLVREGYIALLPNLFSGDSERESLTILDIENGVRISSSPDRQAALEQLPEMQRAPALRAFEWRTAAFTRKTFVPDFMGCLDYARSRPDVKSDAIAMLGFCMGGGFVGDALVRGADVRASVVFYGRLPEPDHIQRIRTPVLCHIGDQDPLARAVPAVKAAAEAAGSPWTFHIYEGAPHAFANYSRESYCAAPAKLAWHRTFAYIRERLS